jgi:uncharacterized protein (TIGR02646 family)
MIKVEREKIIVPRIFSGEEIRIAKQRIHDFYMLPESERRQLRFHVPFAEEIERVIGNELYSAFDGRCAYCESEVEYFEKIHIDHFRPKGGARGFDDEFSPDHYWWLMYEWNNLYLTCETCSRYKSTWFPVDGKRAVTSTSYADILQQEKPWLIDPCHDDPGQHFIFNENGEIDFLTARGKVTIDILKLNRQELIESREHGFRHIYSMWEEFLIAWGNLRYKYKVRSISEEWMSLLSKKNPGPYVVAQQQYIIKLLETHAAVNNYFTEAFDFYKRKNGITDQYIPLRLDFEGIMESKENAMEMVAGIEPIKHVYLDKIELKNYKCFPFIEIGFDVAARNTPLPVGSPPNYEPWLLFLGENGVGKSSILKAIAIALMGNAYRKQLDEEIAVDRLLKHGTEDGYIKLYLKGEKRPVEVHFSKAGNSIRCSHKKAVANLVGYGAIRLLPNKKIQPEKNDFNGVKAKNLFDYSVALADANAWLLQLDEEAFDRAALSLKDLMLLQDNDMLERDIQNKQIYVITGNNPRVAIEELSDGYKSVFALAVDIMSTLASEKVTYDLAEGIVLIDEIGTHLHPRWKMEVVSRLRKCFPRIQFIVTTHEPLCLRGLQANETVVLTRDKDKEIVAITELPDPASMQVDQLLTSEFFGLKSAIDPATEALFEEYYRILAIDEPNRTEEEKNRLLELHDVIPKKKHLGDNLREELVYYVIDELLAKKAKVGLNREALKQEAIEGVKKLWQIVSTNKGDQS